MSMQPLDLTTVAEPTDRSDLTTNSHLLLPDPTRWRRGRWDGPGTIYFYSGSRGPRRHFSNFFDEIPFPMPAWYDPTLILLFDSGEHGFKCAKGRNEAEHEAIRHAGSPSAAK